MQILWSFLIVASLVFVVFRLERLPRVRRFELATPRPHLATDVAWFGVAMTVSAVANVVFGPILVRLDLGVLDHAPTLLAVVLGLAAYDLVAWFVHHLLHRSDVLWEFHKVHHSSLQLDALATTRTHAFEHLVRNLPAQTTLFVLGLPPHSVAVVLALYTAFAILNHSNIGRSLRWLEPVFVTPRLHRRHHALATTGSNLATVFSLWDRMFGSLAEDGSVGSDEVIGIPGERDRYPQRFADAFGAPAVALRRRLIAASTEA